MKEVLVLDYVVIAIFMSIILSSGFVFMKFNKGGSDFYKGGNKIPWLIAGLSAFMAGFSAWTFTGAAGVAYKSGITVILLYFGNSVSFILGYWLFGYRWRRARISSTMEYLSGRFNLGTRQLFSWTTLVFDWFIVASVLYGMSVFISITCGFPIVWTIIASGMIMLFYCFFGGLWAVVITEFLQGIILITFSIVLAAASIHAVGGFSGFFTQLPHEMFRLSGQTEEARWIYILSWTIMVSFGYNTRAHAQRYFSVEDEKAAKRVALLNFVLFFIGTLIWFIPPMAMRIKFPDLSEAWRQIANPYVMARMSRPEEGSYAIASLTLLPNGLIGVMLIAIFSASMSSIAGFYNMHSGIISNDIFRTMINKNTNEKELLLVGRISTLIVGIIVPVLTLFMALLGKSIFKVLVTFNTLISLGYGIPALMGFLIKKTPKWSGLVTFALVIVIGSIGTFICDWGLVRNVLILVPSGMFIFLMSSLSETRDENFIKRRDEFFKNLSTPVNKEKEVGDANYETSVVFIYLSRVTVFLALLCLAFIFFIPRQEYTIVIAFSGIILLSGILFYFLGKKNRKKGNPVP